MEEQKEILDDLDFSKESVRLSDKGNTVVPLLQFFTSVLSLLSFLLAGFMVFQKGVNWYGANKILDEAVWVFCFAFPTSLILAFLGYLLKEPKTWYGTLGIRIGIGLLFMVITLFFLIFLEVGGFK